ncbi:hypothetical protein ABH922_004378 [Rhodococcus sp. 27YEA15]
MGLFRPAKEFRQRTFTAPCTGSEFLQVLHGTSDYDGEYPFQVMLDVGPLSGPPLAETVYIESLSDNGFVVAAGNRVKTLWRMQLELQGDNPVAGSFGSLTVNDERWFGNVMKMNSALSSAARSVGGRTRKWPM